MKKFTHGGNIDEVCRELCIDRENIIDFSANINPLGLSNSVKESILKSIDIIVNYPDITYYNLKKEISNYENINMENLFLGNGAAECIFNVVRAINPKNTLLLAPSFSEYEEAIKSIKSNIEYYFLKEENKFRIDNEILKRLTSNIDLLFICNPNNPTGVLTSKIHLEKIIKKASQNNIYVVVDESFMDFVKDSYKYSVKELLNKYTNLVIIKSVTKFYAIPGLRMGFGITKNKELLKNVDSVTMAWNVNSLASEATISGLRDKEYIEETIDYVQKEKEYLCNNLSKIKSINIFEPSVNFIFFSIDKDIDLKKELLKQGIIIRSCSNYNGLDNSFYRIAVRTREENDKILKVLNRVLNEK